MTNLNENAEMASIQCWTHWGRENGLHFADDIIILIAFYENDFCAIEISVKVVPKGLIINNKQSLVEIVA